MKCLNDVSYKDCIDKVFKSNLSGDFKILKYNDSKDVEIQFVNTWKHQKRLCERPIPTICLWCRNIRY